MNFLINKSTTLMNSQDQLCKYIGKNISYLQILVERGKENENKQGELDEKHIFWNN